MKKTNRRRSSRRRRRSRTADTIGRRWDRLYIWYRDLVKTDSTGKTVKKKGNAETKSDVYIAAVDLVFTAVLHRSAVRPRKSVLPTTSAHCSLAGTRVNPLFYRTTSATKTTTSFSEHQHVIDRNFVGPNNFLLMIHYHRQLTVECITDLYYYWWKE